MRRTVLLWITVAAITSALGACSKTDGTKRPASEQPAARGVGVGGGGAAANVKDDGDFVRDVAMKNITETELSRMALNRATSSEIKFFAQRIIDDHDAAATKLKSVVSGRPIDWPTQLDDKHREAADKLAKQSGVDFDREYLNAIVEGHQDLSAKLESRLDVQSLADWKTAAAGRTETKALPDVNVELHDVGIRPNKSDDEFTMKINQWGADTYPVVQKHLDNARALELATKKSST